MKAKVIPLYRNRILINSGSVSSEVSVRWFQEFLARQHEELNKTRKSAEQLQFRTFYESDRVMTDRFLSYLRDHDYCTRQVAILSEDETAFGTHCQPFTDPQDRNGCDTEDKNQSPIYLYYPRDIATLRSAYEKESVFSAGKQQANGSSTTLRGDLSEPDNGDHDSVRTYAGQLTPLAQESVLFGITNVLRLKHIQFVILRSSNSLDQLFLSEFLRRSYPSGRVVIDGSDLLFRRGMQGASLRGVLLLSPYPLLSWTQDSIPKFDPPVPSSSSYRVFGLDSSEGLYIAARVLLDSIDDVQPAVPVDVQPAVPVSDYGVPGWALNSVDQGKNLPPATWITVVGHRQFWPVAVLNSQTEKHPSLLKPEGHVPPAKSSGAAPSLPGEMAGLLVCCLVLGAWHLYCCWNGSIVASPRVRTYFAPIPKVQHPAFIFLSSVFIGYLGILFAVTLIRNLNVFAYETQFMLRLAVCMLVLFGFLASIGNYRIPVLSPVSGSTQTVKWRWWAPAVLWALTVGMLARLRSWLLVSCPRTK